VQSSNDVHQRTLLVGVRECNHHRNQQHHDSSPTEEQGAEIFQGMVGAKDIQENFMDDLEAEDCVDGLTQPEKSEIQCVATGEPAIVTITAITITGGEIAGEPEGKYDNEDGNLG